VNPGNVCGQGIATEKVKVIPVVQTNFPQALHVVDFVGTILTESIP
jgi:hypothetical protein